MTNLLIRLLGRSIISRISWNSNVDRSDGQPLLAEEALVHAKSDSCDCYVIHFYIAARDDVVNCGVPYEIWRYLEKGWRGILCHQGGLFYSFEHDGEMICEDTIPSDPLFDL